ncbi:hypothetical protein A4G19_14785 [Pasteurellaceae bacterium Macca]|nr:hypothetical protein [Pasteurellaceae bacterium Macca]
MKLDLFSQWYQQAKSAVVSRPVEILLITLFSLPLMWLSLDSHDYFKYWLFTPFYFVVSYLTRPWKIPYGLSLFLPLLGSAWIAFSDLPFESYFEFPAYWGGLLIAFVTLCAFPFEKDNHRFVLRAFYTVFHGIYAYLLNWVIIGILSVLLFSFEALFDLAFHGETYPRLILFSHFTFFPLLLLIFQQRNQEMGISSLLFDTIQHFIFSLALMIYTLILFLYTGKIIVLGELPKGIIATMVIPYLISGLVIYALQILCEKPRWAGFFRLFPYFALVPLGLFAISIEQRVAQYGLTVERVYLIALGVMLALCYGVLWWKRLRQFRYWAVVIITGVSLITMILSPEKIAYQNQEGRFIALLDEMKLLNSEGKIRSDFQPDMALKKITMAQFQQYEKLMKMASYLNTRLSMIEEEESQILEQKMVARYGEGIKRILGLSFNDYEQVIEYEGKKIVPFDKKDSNMAVTAELTPSNEDNTQAHLAGRFIFHQSEIAPDRVYDIQHYKKFVRLSKVIPVIPHQPFCYTVEEANFCLSLEDRLHQIFKAHQLDPRVKQPYEVLLGLTKEVLLMLDTDNGNLLSFSHIRIEYDEAKGYYISDTSGLDAVFVK